MKFTGEIMNTNHSNAVTPLTFCTFTGVDRNTDLERLAEISHNYQSEAKAFNGSQIEWGLLYSPKRQGDPGRYPSMAFLERALVNQDDALRLALHICGSGVTEFLEPFSPAAWLVGMVQSRGGRVQLNFNQSRASVDLERLAFAMSQYPDVTFITQENKANAGVREALSQIGVSNHNVLFDSSGGRGVLCQQWPAPVDVAFGYAGGLGPQTIQAQMLKIIQASEGRPFWIDMEGAIRTKDSHGDDWLDLSLCMALVEKLKFFNFQADA